MSTPNEGMSFERIAGQAAAIGALRQALDGGQLGSAYLFVGPSGVGKQLAALALARAAICSEQPGVGCGQCQTCRRVDQGIHPDVRVFAPRDEGNRNIPVDYLRNEILPLTKFAPFEASAAFLIFPQADLSFPVQHPEAANALLKTLEEPRTNLHFLLLSERPDRLLPTIRSRCQRVRFAPLPDDVISAILTRAGVADAQRMAALELAAGRADRALELAQAERASAMLDWTLRIDAALAQGHAGALIALSEQLAADESRDLIVELLARFYRDLARVALGVEAGAETDGRSARRKALSERATSVSATTAAARVARIAQCIEELEISNANPQLAFEGLLFELRAG